jgi:predicted heme/steroid binding protein
MVVTEGSEKKFTLEVLQEYDGKNGRLGYIAYKGKVYDVTNDPLWIEGDHQGEHKAGVDLTDELKRAPHGEDKLAMVKLIGMLVPSIEASLDMARISKTLSITRSVPIHERFYFYRAIGDPTGDVATSLGDFLEKLHTVDARSISFHFQRQDFEKCIKDVIGDDELSRRIGEIRKVPHGEELDEQITEVVKSRLKELSKSGPTKNTLAQH